jgi:hypothetical protein
VQLTGELAVHDQAQDNLGVEFYRVALTQTIPAYVKAASAEQLKGGPDLAPHAYADPATRRFPCHTAPATWMSYAQFRAKEAELDQTTCDRVASGLRAAGDFWGVRGDLDALDAARVKQADFDDSTLSDDYFAFVTPGERRLRLLNPGEIKVAAEWLGTYRDHFTYADRRAVALRVLARAEAENVKLADDAGALLHRTAGLGTCATAAAVGLIRERAALAAPRNEKLAATLRQVAETVQASSLWHNHGLRVKLACALDEVDHCASLTASYADADAPLDRPEDVLFAVTEKVAGDYMAQRVALPNGTVYAGVDLARLSPAAVADHMGPVFADALVDDTGLWIDGEKLAATVPTLARDDAENFERMTRALRIEPREKSAAVASPARLRLGALAQALTAGA